MYISETKCPLGKRFKEHSNLTIPIGVVNRNIFLPELDAVDNKMVIATVRSQLK